MSRNRASSGTTVAAISTPPGFGGIGVIRISGPSALSILKKIFYPNNKACPFRSHSLYYGHIKKSPQDSPLDEVLAVFMQAPKTYTCEDMVEIHCHGSFIVLRQVLDLTLRTGAKLAEAGEFTKRAFLNGRIDLTKAEAVLDLLNAKTTKGAELAQQQLVGLLYEKIMEIRRALADMLAELEVAIDFPDEDIEIIDFQHFIERITADVIDPLEQLRQSSEHARIYQDGVSVVIAGLPNVGKSSLLNAFLQEDRALVTAIAGTTRDTIEEYVDIGGIPVRMTDTAGIRENPDEVEALGIERAREALSRADCVLFLVDGSRAISEEDLLLYQSICDRPHIVVINKSDMPRAEDFQLPSLPNGQPVALISARHHQGMDALRHALFQQVTGRQKEETGCSLNVRLRDALSKSYEASLRVRDSLQSRLSTDLLAVDFQECLDCLGDIIGETTSDDILDIIFSRFCLGK